jgi:hypothetical protein
MRDSIIGERFTMSSDTAEDSRGGGGEPLLGDGHPGKAAALRRCSGRGSEVVIGGVAPDGVEAVSTK